MKISLFRTNIVSRDFINILTYAKCVTCHRIAEFLNELSEWKAECSKTHLHEKEVEAWLIANLTTQIHRIANLHHSSVKILEYCKQRLHTLHMQDKSSKPKILIYTYWKLAEAGNSKSYTAPQALIDGAISERLHDCTTLFFGKTKIISRENFASRSSNLDHRNSILTSIDSILASRNSKCSSFETWGLSLEFRASSVTHF